MKLTRNRIFELNINIALMEKYSHGKFQYALLQSDEGFEKEVDKTKKAFSPSKKYIEYDEKRLALCEKHSLKKDGKPVMESIDDLKSKYVFSDKGQKQFDKDWEKLKEEYKEILDENDKMQEDLKVHLEEEIEVEIYLVLEENIPVDMNGKDMKLISELIEKKKQSTE